jgi:hypothetical protein
MLLASIRRVKGNAARAMTGLEFGKSKNMKRLGQPSIDTCGRPVLNGGCHRWFAKVHPSHVRQPVWLAI